MEMSFISEFQMKQHGPKGSLIELDESQHSKVPRGKSVIGRSMERVYVA
jgi:hypothetical protein